MANQINNRPSLWEHGAVTAEWALTLPAVGLTFALVLGGVGVTIDHGRLVQAAADGQRVHSFGATPAEVTQHVHQTLGAHDALVSISDSTSDSLSCVTVTRPGFSWAGSLFVTAREATSCGLVVPR